MGRNFPFAGARRALRVPRTIAGTGVLVVALCGLPSAGQAQIFRLFMKAEQEAAVAIRAERLAARAATLEREARVAGVAGAAAISAEEVARATAAARAAERAAEAAHAARAAEESRLAVIGEATLSSRPSLAQGAVDRRRASVFVGDVVETRRKVIAAYGSESAFLGRLSESTLGRELDRVRVIDRQTGRPWVPPDPTLAPMMKTQASFDGINNVLALLSAAGGLNSGQDEAKNSPAQREREIADVVSRYLTETGRGRLAESPSSVTLSMNRVLGYGLDVTVPADAMFSIVAHSAADCARQRKDERACARQTRDRVLDSWGANSPGAR